MKKPGDCKNMQQIRTEIDRIDRDVIALFGQRFQYVKAAARFKTSTTSVRAPERFQAMLRQRRCWAEDDGLDPDVIEKMFSNLVNYFISEELRSWKAK